MADIDVVPKRRTSVWLWVILAIVVIAILWIAMGNRSGAPRSGQNIDRPTATMVRLATSAPASALRIPA
jgi:bacteriorhodopsin